MLENIYTTKMSANKKMLQNRFTKIRKRSGKISKIASIFMSLLILVTMICATIVMASVDGINIDTRKIIFSVNGEVINFKNEPFIENDTVYFPLRELFEKVVIMENSESSLEWENGNVNMTVAENNGQKTFYQIVIGENGLGISHNRSFAENAKELENTMVMWVSKNTPPVIKDGLTYVSYEYLDYMLDRGMRERGTFEMSCVVTGESFNPFDKWNNMRSSDGPDENGITMTAREATPTSVGLFFRGTSGKITYSPDFTIEMHTDKGWLALTKLPEAENALNMEMTFDVGKEGIQTQVFWGNIYGRLQSGVYRISKELRFHDTFEDYKTKTYYAEFAIPDTYVRVTPTLKWPCESDMISNPFGKRTHPITGEEMYHNGMDIKAEYGTDVYSAISGIVTEVGFDSERGNFVVISNKNNVVTLYGQLSESFVKEGDSVNSGNVIGKVGNTGRSTGAHLHYEVMINGERYNPELIY